MKDIAAFCRRVGISVNAGISLVQAINREAGRQKDAKMWLAVAASVEDGETFAGALKLFRKQLGDMFIALIEVGEQSGHLGEMLTELADYYEQMRQIRRDFLKSLTWPIVEFVAAISVIGIMILALGVIEKYTETKIDVFGFGLIGVSGFIKYVAFLGLVGVVGVFLYQFMRRSIDRSRPVHYFLNRIPKIGRLMNTLALTKLTWGLHLTMRTGMDVKRALTLSFSAVGYAPVRDRLPGILRTIDHGGTLTDAFSASVPELDEDLLSSIDSGEQSGNLPELMERMTQRYLQESLLGMKVLSIVGGFLVYGFVAFCIIVVIFRLFSFYMGILQGALDGL